MEPTDPAPIIVTVAIEAADMQMFEDLRRQHFPPERNFLRAHLTMFHHLPGDRMDPVLKVLAEAAAGSGPLPVAVTGLRLLGGGVAYTLESDGLQHLRASLRRAFEPWLTQQDAQGWKPHITVQNKVTAVAARALHAGLQARFTPGFIRAQGLDAWSYRGGPWSPLASFPFSAPAG